MDEPETDLTRLNYYTRGVAEALLPLQPLLESLANELEFSARCAGPCQYATAVIVQSAASREDLHAMAQDPAELLGFVSSGPGNSNYVAAVAEMLRVLGMTPNVPAGTSPADGPVHEAVRTDGVHDDEPVFRGHATVVEHGGRTYIVGIGVGVDVSPQTAAWLCEDVVAGPIRRGLHEQPAT